MHGGFRQIGWAAVGIVPLALLGLLLGGFLGDPNWTAPIFHFFIVSLTSMLAVALALLMLVAANQLKDARVFFLGCAFLGIAGVFLVHALTTPGALVPNNPWVGFASRFSLFVGAIFFFLSTVRWKPSAQQRVLRQQRVVVAGLLLLIVAFGAFAIHSSLANAPQKASTPQSAAPAATVAASSEYGDYGYGSEDQTSTAASATASDDDRADPVIDFVGKPVVSSVVGAITLALLLVVTARQTQLYRLSRTPTLAGFLVSAIFLCQAQLSMTIAPVWHASWWEYHGLMLAGFGAAILGLVVEYSQGGSLAGVVEGLLLRDTISQLQRGYGEVIVALVEAIEAKDPYTRGHTQRVAALAVHLGEELSLSPERLRILHRSAMLHDIGKIGVPDAILNKPGRLSEDEFAVVKEHPVRGHLIVRNVRSLRDEVAGIRSHHERLDGSGYPDGLCGEAIPLDARIIAVADVFDALTSARAYRSAWSAEQALAQIEREAGTKLDPLCVDALGRVLRRRARSVVSGIVSHATPILAAAPVELAAPSTEAVAAAGASSPR